MREPTRAQSQRPGVRGGRDQNARDGGSGSALHAPAETKQPPPRGPKTPVTGESAQFPAQKPNQAS